MDQNSSDLSLYKPSVDIQRLFNIDENLPDNELTFAVHQNLVKAKKIQDATFLVIGRMLKLFRDKKLYKNLDFDTFEQYLASEEISFSREKAYLYIRIYEMFILKFQLDPDETTKLGVTRLMMLVPVLKEVADREEAINKIQEYSELRYNDFVRKIKESTNKDGKPSVFWSEEVGKWIVNFYNDKTHLVDIGLWTDRGDELK